MGEDGGCITPRLQWQRHRDDDLSRLSDRTKIARAANYACAFDSPDFPDHALYNGNPWFLPMIGSYYRLRDRLDRMLA